MQPCETLEDFTLNRWVCSNLEDALKTSQNDMNCIRSAYWIVIDVSCCVLTETGWFTQSSPLESFAAFFSQRSQNGQKRRALMRLKGTTQFEWAQMGWVHQNWFAFESASYSYQRSLGQFSSTQADSFGEGDYSDLSTNWWLVRFVTPSFEVGKSHVQTCPSPMSSP